MNAQQILDLAAGIPAILAAITALVVALKAHSKAGVTAAVVNAHLMSFAHPGTLAVTPTQAEVIPPEKLN
jgi:hypothetical protein